MQKILHNQNKNGLKVPSQILQVRYHTYKIKLTDGTEVRRHVDSIKQRLITTATAISEIAQDFEGPIIESETQEIRQSQLVSPTPRLSQPPEQSELLTGLRRSTRVSRPPQRYTDVQS